MSRICRCPIILIVSKFDWARSAAQVFFTPVMVSVAKSFDAPIKLLFPRLPVGSEKVITIPFFLGHYRLL